MTALVDRPLGRFARTTRPMPVWWIRPSYSRAFARDRAGLHDTIHRRPSCPQSDLNVPWKPAMANPGLALDLVAIYDHLRLCTSCFTETEIETMGQELAYYMPPAESLADRNAYAAAIQRSPSLPEALQGNPGSILLAMDLADALMIRRGIAITQMHYMKGVPVPNANLINGLVRRAGHRLRVVEGKNDIGVFYATATIVRRDDPDFEYSVTWDMDRAKLAGLDSKPAWKVSPQANLKRRAITEVARDACPEVFMGMDLTAGIDIDVIDTADEITQAEPEAAAAPVEDIADAELVDDEAAAKLEDARAEVKVAADTIGWSNAELKTRYAEAHDGQLITDASAEQLDAFRARIEAQLEAFVTAGAES